MQIQSISSEIIIVSFKTDTENLFIGDFIKVTNTQGIGVISQVAKIENSKSNPSVNIAYSKIIFSINQNSTWIGWQGNVPSKDNKVEKVSTNEIKTNLELTSGGINLGQISANSLNLEVNIDKFNCITSVYYDDYTKISSLMTNLITQIAANDKKIIIFDSTDIYQNLEAKTLKAGYDFSLPLTLTCIQSIAAEILPNLGQKLQPVIKNLFLNIESIVNNTKSGFISFQSFKNAILSRIEKIQSDETSFIKNKLSMIEKLNIFANSAQDINILNYVIQNNNFLRIDLSSLKPEWAQSAIDFITTQNFRDAFVFYDNQTNLITQKMLNKIYLKSVNSKTKSFISINYNEPLAQEALGISKNFILTKPRTQLELFNSFKALLNRLNPNECLVYGIATKNCPLIVADSAVSAFSPVTLSVTQEESPALVFEAFPFVEQMQESIAQQEIEPEKEEEPQPIFNFDVAEPQETKVEEPVFEPVEEPVVSQPSAFAEEPEEENIEFEKFSEAQEEIIEYNENDDFSFDSIDFSEVEEEFEEFSTQEVADTPQYQFDQEEDIDDLEDDDELVSFTEIAQDYVPENAINEEYQQSNDIPIYSAYSNPVETSTVFADGDKVYHSKYGNGVIKKVIDYGNKKLCSIQFDDVGRRLLDPELTTLEKR